MSISIDMNHCLICLGSNYNREDNLSLARKMLRELFPEICFSQEEETDSLFLDNPAPFSNQLAVFDTSLAAPEIIKRLKKIEYLAGRRPEDKLQERICLDIDLLMFDGQVLKPEDMKRKYVRDLRLTI